MNDGTRRRPGEPMNAPDLRPGHHPSPENVLQHLYAAGLELQSIRNRTSEPVAVQRLDQLVSEIDAITQDVRDRCSGRGPGRA